MSLGVMVGLLVFLLVIPSLTVGPTANVRYLRTFNTRILSGEAAESDRTLALHTKRNQSLSNAVYRLGNWGAHVFGGMQDDQLVDDPAIAMGGMPMDDPAVERSLMVIRLGLLGLLLVLGVVAARRSDAHYLTVVFSLSCLIMLVLSPIFRSYSRLSAALTLSIN